MNVFVVLDDLNKCPVKTTPAMPLKTVLDTACTKFNLDPNCYGLRFNRKMLDLSIPIRFTNLMAGAKLELVKMNDSSNTCSDVSGVTSGVKPVMINIALQVEDCRITGQYPSTTTLWQILRGAETSNASSSQGLNITRRVLKPKVSLKSLISTKESGMYLMPVCLVMSREFATIEQLQSTTLRDAGISSGSAAIRVLFRETNLPFDSVLPLIDNNDAIVPQDSKESVKAVKNTTSDSTKNEATKIEATTSSNKSLEENTNSSLEENTNNLNSEENNTNNIFDRQRKVLKESTQSVKIELDDSFFQLTATELKFVAQQLTEKRKFEENRPLMTKALRDKKEKEKELCHPKTIIRIRFPQDALLLQGVFLSSESISSVYSFVRENLKVKEAKFYLYQPPQQKFSEFDTLSLYQLQLSPASVLYLMPESEGARLSDEALRLLEELPLHQTLISSDVTTTSGPTSGPTDTPSGPSTVTASSSSGPSNRPTSSNATKQNGMPKWFKGFKK